MGKVKEIDTSVSMDMTPMIDCVFQLIIFFMLITDLSQQELEVLKLPEAKAATEDKPDPKNMRPVINIKTDGTVIIRRDVAYDPELDKDNYQKLSDKLVDFAKAMKKAPFDPKLPKSSKNPEIPDDALLIRADENTPFKYIQKVMELCGGKGIQIWKIELAAAQVAPETLAPGAKAGG